VSRSCIQGKSGVCPREELDAALAYELADCLWSVPKLADAYVVDLQAAFDDTMRFLSEHLNETGYKQGAYVGLSKNEHKPLACAGRLHAPVEDPRSATVATRVAAVPVPVPVPVPAFAYGDKLCRTNVGSASDYGVPIARTASHRWVTQALMIFIF